MTVESIVAKTDWKRGAKLLALVVFVLVLGLFLVAAVPQLVGADHSYVVQSDSMSPAIDAGSVVFVSETPPSEISTGDVITFRDSGSDGETRRVTHRVVGIEERDGQLQFITKGDANEDPDPGRVTRSQLVGVVQFDLPLLGSLLSIVRSPTGIVGLIVLPAIVLAILEVRALLATAETTTTDEEPTEQEDSGDATDEKTESGENQ